MVKTETSQDLARWVYSSLPILVNGSGCTEQPWETVYKGQKSSDNQLNKSRGQLLQLQKISFQSPTPKHSLSSAWTCTFSMPREEVSGKPLTSAVSVSERGYLEQSCQCGEPRHRQIGLSCKLGSRTTPHQGGHEDDYRGLEVDSQGFCLQYWNHNRK